MFVRRRPLHGISPSAIFALLLVTVGLGTVSGWLIGTRYIPLVPQAYLQSPPLFDLCFPSQAACQAPNASCYEEKCYYHSSSAEWCCPIGCTLEEICGDLQVVGSEECDHGGTCSLGGNCDTVENAKRCVAKGGTCAPVADTFCTATCQNIPPCGDGTCSGGENCRTCASDCACSASQTCDTTGTCVGSGLPGGSRCGDGTVNAGEQCDDGNNTNGNGCSATCVCEACGDGYKCATEQCDDGNGNDNDACSNSCVIQPTCTDGIKNQGEAQTDCGGTSPCAACPCTTNADCNDGLYCTKDTCVTGSCQYTAFNGTTATDPCSTDYRHICVNPANCSCNEATNRCELCKSPGGAPFNETQCATTSNALCQDYGNPTGCSERIPPGGQWCCPGRE